MGLNIVLLDRNLVIVKVYGCFEEEDFMLLEELRDKKLLKSLNFLGMVDNTYFNIKQLRLIEDDIDLLKALMPMDSLVFSALKNALIDFKERKGYYLAFLGD